VYSDQASERFFTLFQEELRQVGITLNLRVTTFETLVKLLDDRAFELVMIAYTGELFPSPEMTWLSTLADQRNTYNITGFKNARVDEIIRTYQKSFDFDERIRLLKELDGLVTSEHHWILEWTAPYERFIYWSKFGQPPGYLKRTGDTRDVWSLWWNEPAEAQRLDEARRNPGMQLGQGNVEDRYWLEFAQREAEGDNPVTR
jgi:ABC-type oligopeptide transport system substrate-binding subunit